MDGSSAPPSDLTAMSAENEDSSRSSRDRSVTTTTTTGQSETESTSSASSNTSDTTSTGNKNIDTNNGRYTRLQPELTKFLGLENVMRAASASPVLTGSSSAPPQQPGRGCVPDNDEITISVTPTTGGQFELTVEKNDTVENLKKIISRKLKVPKERICLLHRESLLLEGSLEENHLQNGSRLTLLPNVETGLLVQRPEQSVMQALESLNDSQVNDFLSGKAPLNLTMRLGNHMMLIQLQLSTATPTSPTTSSQSSANNTDLNIGMNPSTGTTNVSSSSSHVSSNLQSRRSTLVAARSSSSNSTKLQTRSTSSRTASIISSLISALHATANCTTSLSTATTTTPSPVCSSRSSTTSSSVSSSSYSRIGSSKFCGSQQSNRSPTSPVSSGNSAGACNSPDFRYLHHLHRHRRHHRHHHHHHHHHNSRNKNTSPNSTNADHLQQTTSNNDSCVEESFDAPSPTKKFCTVHHHGQSNPETSRSCTVEDNYNQSPGPSNGKPNSKAATLDTKALFEASRNLMQKLRQLSSEVLSSRVDLAEESARPRHGAIIESMHHHGKGVYSGTFSGTLNPALQDRHGRPKRDISTIIHILNELLCATPAANVEHYRHDHRHSSGRQQSSTSTASTGTTMNSNGNATPVECHDSTTSEYSTEELSRENEATKWKMRRLRFVMEQRRAERRARRQAPVTPDPDTNRDPNTSTSSSPTSGTPNTTEPQNEPELQPCSPEPVVA